MHINFALPSKINGIFFILWFVVKSEGRIKQSNFRRHKDPLNSAAFLYISTAAGAPVATINTNWENYYGNRDQSSSSDNLGDVNSFSASQQKDCSLYPNGTYTTPHTYTCDPEDRPPTFVVHDSAFSNYTGDYEYPVQFSGTLRLFLDVTSYAVKSYNSMRTEVSLYRRKTGWLGCGWIFIPTLGLLDTLEVCEDNNNCPVYPGRQVVEIKFDPSPMLSRILTMVHDDRIPYQMKLRVINNREMGEELLCIVLQARIEI